MKRFLLALAVACLLAAQDQVDEATVARIRGEESGHSQLMHTLHMLTDRYGPRVTGSPITKPRPSGLVAEFTRWGLKNSHLEPWDFGHPGWLNERATAFLVAPVRENLKFEVLAWTPSTNGTVTASAIEIVPPQGPLAPAPANAANPLQATGAFGGAPGGPAPQSGSDPPGRKWTVDGGYQGYSARQDRAGG